MGVYDVNDIPEKAKKDYADVLEVGVAAKILSIGKMDLAEGTFYADLNVNVAWKGGTAEDGPVIQIYNQMELDEERSPEEGAKKGAEGWTWFYRIRYRGVFRQTYDLRRFPFDIQTMQIDVRLKSACRLTHLAWNLDGSAINCDPRAVSEEFWLLKSAVEPAYLPSFKFGKLGGYDPEARIKLIVKRKPAFWATSYGLLNSFVCTLMFATFAIPADTVDGRIGAAFTLVLTMTATKYLMMEKLPPISYHTLLDNHIYVCSFFLFGLTAWIGMWPILGQDDFEKHENTVLFWSLIVWVVWHLFAKGVILYETYFRKIS